MVLSSPFGGLILHASITSTRDGSEAVEYSVSELMITSHPLLLPLLPHSSTPDGEHELGGPIGGSSKVDQDPQMNVNRILCLLKNISKSLFSSSVISKSSSHISSSSVPCSPSSSATLLFPFFDRFTRLHFSAARLAW